MPAVIIDSGDGNYPATLTGTYVVDELNKTVSMGVDGQAESNFNFPATPWILTEVFDLEGVQYDLGLTVFSDDVSNILVDIEALRQEALLEYTTFTITTTYYKGSELVDVYRGDEANQQCLSYPYKDLSFTPSVFTWKITQNTTAPLYEYILYPSESLYPSECLYPGY